MRQDSSGYEEVNAADLLRVLWRRKAWIVAFTSLLSLIAIGYAFLATEWFRAEAVLMPRETGPSGGLTGQLAQLGGLASMAGITLGQASKQEPLGVLRSAGFAQRFVEQNDLVSTLAEKVRASEWGGDRASDRDVQRIVDLFRKSVMSISEEKKTGLITVGIEWTDPVDAAKWANEIPRQLNREMRQRALDESSKNVQYLKGQLANTDAISLQQAIARILESEMQKLMLAKGADEYALRVIDSAQPPSRRARPQRTILIIGTFLAGFFVSILLALVIDPFRALIREVKKS